MAPRLWTIKPLLDVTADYLSSKGIDSPRLNAELLLAHHLGCRRLDLYLRFDQPLKEDELAGYREFVRRRTHREPLQYIRGRQEFWSLDFEVSEGVLIPRPETERLVERALSALETDPSSPPGRIQRVLDLGTGSGILAVVLARERKNARVYASDVSPKALSMARRNAEQHGVGDRIVFVEGDLFQPFRAAPVEPFDLIASNPPYVAEETLKTLAPEVRDYEPREALDGGKDGMRFVTPILQESPAFLVPGGWLLVEMDPGQIEKARAIAEATAAYDADEVIQDYSGRQRVLCVQKKT
jgi:release factor glutamine methyltransferase